MTYVTKYQTAGGKTTVVPPEDGREKAKNAAESCAKPARKQEKQEETEEANG